MSEKTEQVDERVDVVQAPDHVEKDVETKVVTGGDGFNQAMLKEPPSPWAHSQIMIYMFSLVAFFCSTMNGYDGSLINNLLQNPWFRDQYGVGTDGIGVGILTSIYQIGGVVALPFVGPAMDSLGRRKAMAVGAILVIIGTVIQGTSHGSGQFMAGRFFLGFGVSFTATAGPTYVVEINHPAYRGVVGAMYNTLWFSGAILASGAARGGLNSGGDYSFRLIIWLQLLFSGLIVLFCLFLPESPRWLYVQNKKEEAKDLMTKYHTSDSKNSDSIWVQLQLQEYEELLKLDGADKRWWDYSALFRDRASVYRLGASVTVSAFSQWLGNGVLSYYLASVLTIAGYRDAISQANITLINSCQQFLFAICGAFLVERAGRRPLLLFSFAGCAATWLGMTIASAKFIDSYTGDDADGNPIYANTAASKAALAMIFIFGAVFSVGVTPLQGLYIVEALSYEQRAKGLAFGNLATNLASLLNQFAWPIALNKIGWKVYIIFAVWDTVMTIFIYFFLPETKGRTLEELDEIFAARNPVKASTAKKTVMVDRDGDIVNVQDA